MTLKKYQIEITEILQRIVEIDANSLDDAIIEINKKYKNQEIILDSSDYIQTNISEFNGCK